MSINRVEGCTGIDIIMEKNDDEGNARDGIEQMYGGRRNRVNRVPRYRKASY